MEKAGAVALTFFIAFFVSYFEHTNTAYPNTTRFIWRSRYLIGYSAMYGSASALVLFGLDALIESGRVTLEGLGVGNIWIQAIVVGLSAKAVLNINVATFNSVPIGFRTIIYPVERYLLASLESEEWNTRSAFVGKLIELNKDLDVAKQKAADNVPPRIKKNSKGADAYVEGINSTKTVSELLDFVISNVDARTFNRIFPAS